MTQIAARDIQVGMRTSFLGLFRINAVARVSNGDIYYRTALGVSRVNPNRIIEIRTGDKNV